MTAGPHARALAPAPAEPHDSAFDAVCRRHVSRGRMRLASMLGGHVEVFSSGATVRTDRGLEFLNFGGYGVFFTGARHPRVVAAVEEQLRTHPLGSRVLLDPSAALAAEALTAVTPPGLRRVYFTGSGTEATEAALKLARVHGRRRLVSMVRGYHGKTLGALSITARSQYQDPFRPLLPEVVHVPFGSEDALSDALGGEAKSTCVFVEPVQGEGGVVMPPPGYLRRVGALCRERGAFLVLDEVLTGLGRLGHLWGADWGGVVPDMLLVGKTLSGGVVPCAALVTTEAVFAPFDEDPYLHTSTFSGAPIAMAAARAAVEVIVSEGLVERARAVGATLAAGVHASTKAHCAHLVREVRGLGLLLGVEFMDAGVAGEFILELIERGVIANHSLNAHPVVRFTPPAVVTDAEVTRFLEALDGACRALGTKIPPMEAKPCPPSNRSRRH